MASVGLTVPYAATLLTFALPSGSSNHLRADSLGVHIESRFS